MKSDSPAVNPAPPLWPIILAAGIVLGLSLGQRHSVGLYQLPLVQSFGLTRETFSFASPSRTSSGAWRSRSPATWPTATARPAWWPEAPCCTWRACC